MYLLTFLAMESYFEKNSLAESSQRSSESLKFQLRPAGYYSILTFSHSTRNMCFSQMKVAHNRLSIKN